LAVQVVVFGNPALHLSIGPQVAFAPLPLHVVPVLVPVLVTTTVAFATIPPWGSFTVPWMVPRLSWAATVPATVSGSAADSSAGVGLAANSTTFAIILSLKDIPASMAEGLAGGFPIGTTIQASGTTTSCSMCAA